MNLQPQLKSLCKYLTLPFIPSLPFTSFPPLQSYVDLFAAPYNPNHRHISVPLPPPQTHLPRRANSILLIGVADPVLNEVTTFNVLVLMTTSYWGEGEREVQVCRTTAKNFNPLTFPLELPVTM